MVNTIQKQTIVNGERNLVVKVHIDGDGSGDESGTTLIDLSAYDADATEVKIKRLLANFSGFTGELIWDADTDLHAVNVPDYDVDQNYHSFGGLPNNAGAGKTGDILITTTGLGAGDTGHIVLEMVKKF